MPFIHDDFLLRNEYARQLFHEYAADEPILDYHCHLPPQDIADNRQFGSLYEIWLEGDHYKWRAMRANGVDEARITGSAEPREKFQAWAATVPYTLRNPLYHWTHLELKRYFGIDQLLDETTADSIWEQTCDLLRKPQLSAHGILGRFSVRAVCTTDDPADDLEHHRRIRESELPTRVFPTFRPDKVFAVGSGTAWNAWLERLAATADVEIVKLEDLLTALRRRHDAFHELGGRLSDHGLESCFGRTCDEASASEIFNRARSGQVVPPGDAEQFGGFMMDFFGRLDVDRGWTKQLHLGALRNTNTRQLEKLGPDTGFDSIGDFSQAQDMCRMLDRMDRQSALPKMVVYNLNPADNYLIAAMLGSFQGGVPGKMQFGSGWWYLDQREAMRWQLNALSNIGLLSRFIGMLTDSRSFMSYPRHEYFRRVLCDLLGRDMKNGELPGDLEMVGGLVRRICYTNAREYLGLQLCESE